MNLLIVLFLTGAIRVYNPFHRNYWSYFSETCQVVQYRDGSLRLYNNEFNSFTTEKLDWIACAHVSDTLTVYSLKGKRGYLNLVSGKIQIKPKYRHAWQFSEGLAAVDSAGMIGFIDRNDKVMIPFKFRSPHPFRSVADLLFKDCSCTMMDTTGHYGLIDRGGNWVVSPVFSFVNNPVLGMRIVQKDWKYGLLDKQLKLILPCEYNNIVILKEGLKVFKDGEQKLISHDATRVLKPFVYDNMLQLQYDTGIVDKDGNPVMKNANCLAYEVFTDWGLMTLDGKVLTKAIYDKISGATKDLFSCEIEDYSVTINSKGQEIR